jgi:hypothetical protein
MGRLASPHRTSEKAGSRKDERREQWAEARRLLAGLHAPGFLTVFTYVVAVLFGVAVFCTMMQLDQMRLDGFYAVLKFLVGVPGSLLVATLCLRVAAWGASAKTEANRVERVKLLTRQTAGHLTPEESLLRASSADAVPQETVLLRAATSGQETPAEELLRPASREED